MFVCRSCARRASSALARHVSGPGEACSSGALATLRASSSSSSFPSPVRRSYGSAFPELEQAAGLDKDVQGGGLAVAPRPAKDAKSEKRMAWVVRKHLEHMKDPWKIADHVKRTLDKDRYEEALELTRTASKDAQCQVSWNHLIDYQLRNQKLHGAVKLLNEMKKRGQLPNAQTYTIIFRGCASSAHPKLAVSEAIRIYNNLLRDSRLSPNTIHLNAVLQVCARAGDSESMFTVVQSANDGLRAPNNLTYTTILNALRSPWLKRTVGDPESAEEETRLKSKAIQRSKMLWEEVVGKWRKGQLIIDEELMCAMGRVLLLGGPNEADEVLSLVQQTMGIPRPDTKDVAGNTSKQVQKAASPYGAPGRNALSLIMESLMRTRKTSLAPQYWTTFTETYSVVPDSQNWFSYLQVLWSGKASGKAAEAISAMPSEFLREKTFEVALKTCVRDNLNNNAFDNASKIYDVMMSSLKTPSVRALRLYLQAATGNDRKFQVLEGETGDAEGAKLGRGRQLVQAVDRVSGPLDTLIKEHFRESFDLSVVEKPQVLGDERTEVVALARKMLALTDKVITEAMAGPEILDRLKTRRKSLNNFVLAYFDKPEVKRAARRGSENMRARGAWSS